MRRLAQLVALVVTLVVPRVQAQAPAYTFGVPPLVPPRNAALLPGGRLGARVPPALVARAWVEGVQARRRPPWASPEVSPAAVAAARPPALPPPAPPAPTFEGAQPARGVLGYADIGMQLNLRFELKADQFRNLSCTSQERLLALSGCSGGFPTITPNPQYSIRTAGVVGQRLHLDVDFDSEREFDANNNLHVWYEGLEDEILRRVEAGNVTFQAPPSRFITAAVPANNFGVQAIAQVGPVELRGILAQQKGNVVKDRFYTVGDVTRQPIDREARDLDYEPGRFFFVIDPAALPGFPAVDILQLDQTIRPDSLTVGALRVFRRRAIAPGTPGNQNVGGVRAVACGPGASAVDCTLQREGPFEWEILQEGKDYYVDPSGTWFALANRLDQADYLAVSYITASQADTIGTFPVDASPDTTVVDTLRLVYDPKPAVNASSPTFRFEIRSAYRVGGREIERASVELAITVNQRERSAAGDTYVERLGVALDNDPTRFDQYNRLFPRTRDPNEGDPVRDMFIVFPHLAPFGDSAKLVAIERNDSLYRTPRAYLATQGPPSVFALQLHVEATASADRSLLSLNSFQIREGSEHIYVRNTLLQRDIDYSIDYTTGQVQFKNPDALFQGTAQVRAQFEERAAFSLAPTTTYGLSARYDLGAKGQVNLMGIFQNEQSSFTRPPLGFEPSSGFVGGISTQLQFQPELITRIMDWLPGVRTTAPSALSVNAELAVSKPSPNKFGQAYLEEFEGGVARSVPLADNAWHWGSIPSSARGVEGLGFASGFDSAHAAFLTWQSLPYNLRDGQYVPVQYLPTEIDPTLRVVGQAQAAEPVLWLMLKPDTVLGLANNTPGSPSFGLPNWVRPHQDGPRWRSITQTLSATGVDLSRVEFLEFWVWEDPTRIARAHGTTVLFDFGGVFEDAFAIVPTSFTVSAENDTSYFGIKRAGVGRLDTERDPVTQTWSASLDDQGILSDRVTDTIFNSSTSAFIDTLPLCSATENGQLVPYAWGDIRSRCGRHNNAIDTEDQDGDFSLDILTGVRTAESFVRYVFPIGDERYFVREGGGFAGAKWRLYRIPFRADTLQIGTPQMRQVQSLRITIVAPAGNTGAPDSQVYFALSRVRLIGSSWVKRADTPLPGIGGERGTGTGEVIASVVSTENRDLGYTPPPGVFDAAGRRDASFQVTSSEINERSLRLLARGLEQGLRAEAYLRFTTEGDKNFLKYQTLRVWARGRGAGWEDGDLEFFIKAGKDQDNFYMYHTPARTVSWEPEVIVQFERWLVLRARIEQAWLSGDTARVYAGCPDSTLVPHDGAYVMCDGPYIVHIRDPGSSPPNLARVQEIAAGMWRVQTGVFIDQAELWVDDIRLGDVVQETGAAGAVDVAIAAADVGDLAISLSRRDGQFRQLTDDPSYVTNSAANVSGTLRLDRFLPARWGLSMPVSFQRILSTSDPFYLDQTDIRADALPGLRKPRSNASSYAFAARRVRLSNRGLGRWLLDPVSLSGSYTTGDTRSSLSRATASSYAVNFGYDIAPNPAVVRLGGLGLRLNPSRIRFRSGWLGSDAERFTYLVPIELPGDTARPALSQTRYWVNAGGLQLAPFTIVQLGLDATSTRDLRDYGDSTTMGQVIRQESATLFGADIGIETQRQLRTNLSITPRLIAIRPRLSITTSFTMTRDANARDPVREVGDTAGAFHVPVSYGNQRRVETGAQFDIGRLARGVLGDSAGLARLLARITGVDLSYSTQLGSTFSRASDAPPPSYQFAIGGLDAFREVDGLLAAAATQGATLATSGAAALPLGLRANAAYRRTNNVGWTLRSDQQVPLRSTVREWPSGSLTWAITPSRRNLGRLLTTISARAGYREAESVVEQPSFGAPSGVTLTTTNERVFTPSASLGWIGGVFTSLDVSRSTADRVNAGNLFRTERNTENASLTFSFRPPFQGGRWRSLIRTTAGYSLAKNTTCLRRTGTDTCVPYVDSRQTQAQLTLDTELPSNMSAGLQMAYVLNEERQSNRKVSQFGITAFVQIAASVGQLR